MKKLLVPVVVVIAAIAAVIGYRKIFSKPEIKVLEAARVVRGNIRGVLFETGIIKPQVGALVKVGTRATGTIVKMGVKVGDRVEQGQLIALIDDREIRRGIEQQEAALSAARNTLAQTELTFPARIREAESNVEYARMNYDRQVELVRRDYVARDTLDRARNQLETSEAILGRLRREYDTQRRIAQANVADRAAQVQQQQVRLTYTEIYAPVTGIVSEVTAQEGETMVAGLQVANLVTILDPKRLEMWTYVDETDVGRIALGQTVEYYVDTFPNQNLYGTIEKIYPQPVVRDNIVYYLAIVKVSTADAELLKPEMTTHVKVIYSWKEDVLMVPNGAIKFERGKQVVYQVIGHDRVEKVDVTLGLRGEEATEILAGVKEGEEVAVKLILPVSPKPENTR